MAGPRFSVWVLIVCVLFSAGIAVAKAQTQPDTLILASHHFPPYSIAPERREGAMAREGIFPEIVREAATRAGWSVDIRFVPFKRTDASVTSNRAHALISHKLVGWRASQYRYTRSLLDVEPAFFTLKGQPVPSLKRFADAAKVSVAVVLGDALIDELSGRGIPAMEVPDLENAVRMLRRGRMTALLSLRRPVELALAEAQLLSHVNIQVIQKRPIHLAIKRDLEWSEGFILKFDQALVRMRDAGRIEEIAGQYSGAW